MFHNYNIFNSSYNYNSNYSYALLQINQCNEKTKSLQLDKLNLDIIPDNIHKLAKYTSLQRIDLSYNNFSYISNKLTNLTQIRELKLCSNRQIPFFIPKTIGRLKNLVILSLSGNSLSNIPLEIGTLTTLRILDLRDNNLSFLPDSFSLLNNLSKLCLDNNQLTHLPRLTNTLTYLSLSYNTSFKNPSKIIQQIYELSNLNHLILRSCNISSIIRFIAPLTFLDLGCNYISSICENTISHLHLRDLYLDHNQLLEIPDDISKLSNLSSLLLHGNNISEIPLSFCNLKNLKEFTIDEDNILIPPREIIQEGISSILDFLQSLSGDSIKNNRIRLFIIGSQFVGKSTLVKTLMAKKISKKSQLRKNNKVKPNVTIQPMTLSTKIEDGSSISIDFLTWDFKDDCLLFSKYFIASKSMYIIVLDLRNIVNTTLRRWLKLINTNAGSTVPIIIVCTHADDKIFKDKNNITDILNNIVKDTSSFSNIQVVTAVSCYDGTGIESLRISLIQQALKQNSIGKVIPKSFTLLEDAITNLKKTTTNSIPFLSWGEYKIIGASSHIHTSSNLRLATLYLENLGLVTTFVHPKCYLSHEPFIIYKPLWICKLIKVILKYAKTKFGFISHTSTVLLLKEHFNLPKDKQKQCLSLLLYFEIILPATEYTYCIPSLFKENKPDVQIIWSNHQALYQTERVWKFDYIPSNIFAILQSRIINHTNTHPVWTKGCIFEKDSEWGIIEEYQSNNIIRTRVRSFNRINRLISIITDIIEQIILNYFPNINYQLIIVCSHCIQNNAKNSSTYLIYDCEKALLENKNQLLCTQDNIKVKLQDIAPDISLHLYNIGLINPNDIIMDKKELAKGAYGVLYKGIYNNKDVAVKLLFTEGKSLDEQLEIFREFRKEVSLTIDLKHENIVQLYGFFYKNNEMGLVMELISDGDLNDLIHDKTKPISIPIFLKIAFDIAKGLYILHSQDPPIIHRDLKPANILLQINNNSPWKYTAKLADFGLSTRKYLDTLKERAVETPIWLAPEILCGGSYSTHSDVYAFGIILYEILARKLPFENVSFRFLNQLEEKIISGERCDITDIEKEHPTIAQLIKTCWQTTPTFRPDFKAIMFNIITISQKYNEELNIYLNDIFTNTININTNNNYIQSCNTNNIEPMGKCIKKFNTNIDSLITNITIIGHEIWVGHKNGDISVWKVENGNLLGIINAAHPQEITVISSISNRVWTASRNGLIIYQSPSYPQYTIKTNILREGYLEYNENKIFVTLTNRSTEFVEDVSLQNATVSVSIEEDKYSFIIQSQNHIFRFYCETDTERDGWIDSITLAISYLNKISQNLFLHRLRPTKGRIPPHSIIELKNLVYIGYPLYIRTHNPNTYEFLQEYPLTIIDTPKVLAPTINNFITAKHQNNNTKRASFNLGTQRGNSTQDSNVPSKLSDDQKKSLLIYSHQDSIWIIIHSFILKYRAGDLVPLGFLGGHNHFIRDMCSVYNTLWSCSEDKTIRVWCSINMYCLKIIRTPCIIYSLLHFENHMWAGGEKQIVIWNINNYTQEKTPPIQHSDPIIYLLSTWKRVIWSVSLDNTICAWK